MYFKKTLKSGTRVTISVPRFTEARLRTTCFRGKFRALAGNFKHWDSVYQLFSDTEVRDCFLTEVDSLRLEENFGTYSVNIVHTAPVGWESTDALENYRDTDLEVFRLNRKSTGFRVKSSRENLLAPLTHELTIVFQFDFDHKGLAPIIIRSIYPGKDVGELKGDVTNREKRIFFDWNHPGQV